jgi:hypothetical protein
MARMYSCEEKVARNIPFLFPLSTDIVNLWECKKTVQHDRTFEYQYQRSPRRPS